MIKKITVISVFLLMFAGIAFAADTSSFKAPNDFVDLGDGVYVLYDLNQNATEILSVVKFNQHDWDDYTTNDTENNYTVTKGKNNTYNFIDLSVNETGSFELIEVDGNKFIVDFAKIGTDDAKDFNVTFNNLLDFNKLNNVTAIEK